MIKLAHFSENSLLEKYDELKDLKTSFEVFKNEPKLSAEDILKQDLDVIELAAKDFANFLPLFSALDIKISRLTVADTLIRKNNIWYPANVLPDSVYNAIITKVPDLKNADPAVVIGEYEFVLAMSYKLAQSGFLKIIVAMDDQPGGQKIKAILKQFIFGVVIEVISLEGLTQLDSSNGLLIINLSKEKYPEAHESVTYFNFLSSHAVFVDLQSRQESSLVEEARRAELTVVGEIEILKAKYQALLEIK